MQELVSELKQVVAGQEQSLKAVQSQNGQFKSQCQQLLAKQKALDGLILEIKSMPQLTVEAVV